MKAMTNATTATCLVVDKTGDDKVAQTIGEYAIDQSPEDDVLVEIAYSALNYKDALAATGHPGVALKLPLVPGIDAIGKVIESRNELVTSGQQVIIGHADFGTSHWGGWSNLVRVPGAWCIPLPEGLSDLQAAVLGTAGFTAAQSVDALIQHNVKPSDGPIAVSGATGGVGIMSVKLLAQLGYDVVASTGKPDRQSWLTKNGATEVVSRSEFEDSSRKPLLSAKWAGVVDTVGGNPLASLIRATKPGGCVTACGLVAGADLPVTVYPFILRGVTLQGIASAEVSRPRRIELWEKLAGDWRLSGLEDLATQTPLSAMMPQVEAILNGQIAGRIVVCP